MIYDLAKTSLESLATGFSELGRALSSLGLALVPGDERKDHVELLTTAVEVRAGELQTAADAIRFFQTAKDALEEARRWYISSGMFINSGESQATGIQPTFERMFPRDRRDPQGNAIGDSAEVVNCRNLLEQLAEMITEVLGELDSITDPVGPPFNLRQIRNGVDNITAYPMLVSDNDTGSASPSGSAGTATVQRLVDSAMRQTLGRLPKYTDNKAFIAALNQSFEIKEVDGQRSVSWRVRSYVGQTELGGGVTGFQASLYARAREALSQAVPLLERLHPLLPDADVEEMGAARSIVRTQFTSLVDELGVEGGPRPVRVDRFFETLLRQEILGLGNRKVLGGMVGYLGEVYGLRRDLVNTIDEERNFSDFLLLRDYLVTTENSWVTFKRDQFGRDLGTRLVILSNALQVVAESVDESESAMDSVFVGPAERSVAEFRTDSRGGRMLVSELLSWIRSFAADEAPQLAQDGGRRGVGAIIGTAQKLEQLVDRLIDALTADPQLPAGLRHPRVRYPLSEIRSYLNRVAEIATQVHEA